MFQRNNCNFALQDVGFMDKRNNFEDICNALDSDNLQLAQQLIEEKHAEIGKSSTLLYLKGKLYMKQSQWGKAISCFLQSEKIEPNEPARQCREMLIDIMQFYNKDMYNQ